MAKPQSFNIEGHSHAFCPLLQGHMKMYWNMANLKAENSIWYSFSQKKKKTQCSIETNINFVIFSRIAFG